MSIERIRKMLINYQEIYFIEDKFNTDFPLSFSAFYFISKNEWPSFVKTLDKLQENPGCTKNNNRDKLLLTSLAEQIENSRGREKNYRTENRGNRDRTMNREKSDTY